jgi:phosphoglycerol transferase MdoB-like AlkP superfamily enzyme
LQGLKINSPFLNIPAMLLLRRLALALLILMAARITFWVFNANQFVFPGFFKAFEILFWGAYFDVITLFYCLSPFILIHLLPGNWFYNPKIQTGLKLFFIGIIFILFTLTCIDAGYFPFSKSRLNITLFKMAGVEEIRVIQYIFDYWWFVPVILVMVFLTWQFYPIAKSQNRLKWYFQIPLNILVLAFLVLTIRGGFRLKPLRSIDTALFVPASHSQLSISSGFNILESFTGETINIPKYFTETELKEIMKGDYHVLKSAEGFKKKNIVILILESFGKEYTFPETDEAISYSPFLQKLAKFSTFYNRAYSNGTRSVDAIPSILEGVPKLTKTDFMYSNYIHNITPGFPFYLKKEGYECAFYHGGKNGTLGFEAFLKSRGWNYYGKDQYQGTSADFDGQWGIYDGPYLQYVAKQLGQTKQPFVASVFTLSSHHPYTLPKEFKDSFKTIKKPILKTVRYTDQCLKAFFQSIKNEPWFKETVFIITADHSSENFTKRYQSKDGRYEVPLLVYDAGEFSKVFKSIFSGTSIETSCVPHGVNNSITQHVDIIPLVLKQIGYSGKIFTLGTYFEKPENKMAFQNEEGNYQIITNHMNYTFDGNKFKGNKKNQLVPYSLQFILKAKIQDYNYRLVNNRFW